MYACTLLKYVNTYVPKYRAGKNRQNTASLDETKKSALAYTHWSKNGVYLLNRWPESSRLATRRTHGIGAGMHVTISRADAENKMYTKIT